MKTPKLYNVPMPKDYCFDSAYSKVSSPIDLTAGWFVDAPDSLREIAAEYAAALRLPAEGDKPISLAIVPMKSEAYAIKLDETQITVTAGDKQGLRYALYTLLDTSGNLKLPTGSISDEPLLKMRGYHLNLSTLSQMTMDELLLMVKWAANAKLNTLLIEYDNRFPFKRIPSVRSHYALTPEQVKTLVSTAQGYGMDVIPLMQTFGHLEYILSDPSCADIREVKDAPSQLCPRNPASFEFIKGMIDEYLALHPGIRFIHLGGDETRQLGRCPECAAFVEKYGVGRLYAELMNKVIDYVCSKGVTPMLYDDMLCTHPDALDLLDRRAVIVYWDYWATAPEVPHLIARYGSAPTYTYDSRWNGIWKNELDDVARRVLEQFAPESVDDVEQALGPAFMARYGRYLGDRFPKYFRAFPYLEYYQDQGFRVVGMPTSMGNTDNYLGMPNQARFTANIRVCCERMAEAGAMGTITSAWYPFPAPMYPLGICTAAYYSWGLPDYAASLPDWRKTEA